MSNERRFDLNDLITEEDIASVERAAERSRKWREEVEWRREHDPNFEEWYANECKKIEERISSRLIDYSIEEIRKMSVEEIKAIYKYRSVL